MCELSEKENFNREVKLAQVMLDNNVVALRGLGFKKYKLDARQLFLSPIADSLFSGKRQNRGQTGDKQGTNLYQKTDDGGVFYVSPGDCLTG